MSIDPSTSGTLDFKQASKITFVGSSSNTVIDTVTGSFGIGVDVNGPSSNLHVVGNTRLEGDINMLHTSNNAAIKLNSNVVTEFPRSKKLIKYPRVALTQNDESGTSGYVASASTSRSNRGPYQAFDNVLYSSWHEPDYTTNPYPNTDGAYTGGSGTVYDTNGYQGEYLQIQLPEKIKLYNYSISNRAATGLEGRQPKDAKIFASNDGNTWIDIHTHSDGGGTYDIAGETRSFQFDNITETHYKYYRLVINSIIQGGTNDTANISQWKLYGIPEYDPDADGVDVKVTSYPNVPNTDWLEVYYDAKDLADGAATSVDDLTPSGTNDGTATNVTVSDGAFVFNGTDSRISGSITQSAGAYVHTASLWFYTNDDLSELTENKILFQIGDGSTNTSPKIELHTLNRIYVSFVGNYVFATEASRYIQGKKWFHVLYTYDGGPLTLNNPALYINNTRIGFSSAGGSQVGNTLSLGANPQLRIGCNSNNTGVVNGKIANFRLFNRALTSDEVWQLYAYQKEYFGHGDLSMTLKAGRLGIGTSEPRAVLDVRGDVMSSSPVYFYLGINSGHVASTTKIPFNVIRVNKGGGYDAETYNFTAPIGGWYWMAFGGCNRSSSSVLHMSLKDGPNSSDSTILMAYDRPSGQSLMHANRSGLVYIREGGIVSLWVTSSTVDGGNGFGGASVEWGGFLVSREFQGEN